MKAISVLVTGATGHQGNAVARRLLQHGHQVRALIRDADSLAAHELKRLGAQLALGDFDDQQSLVEAMKETDAVYAITLGLSVTPGVEIRQGKALMDAAKTAGVGHVLYSSVAGASSHTKVPHFDSKHLVEQYLRSLKIPFTVIAPVFFMDNLFGSWILSGIQAGVFALGLPKDRVLQQIALSDLASFAALVLENRSAFSGHRVELAGDELSMGEEAQMLSDLLGREIRYLELTTGRIRVASEPLALMYQWLDQTGYQVNIEELRTNYPTVGWHRFGDWLRARDLTVLNRPPPYAAEAGQTEETI